MYRIRDQTHTVPRLTVLEKVSSRLEFEPVRPGADALTNRATSSLKLGAIREQ